jgi:hypothetical protein
MTFNDITRTEVIQYELDFIEDKIEDYTKIPLSWRINNVILELLNKLWPL